MVEYVKAQLCEKWGEWGKNNTYEYIGNPKYLKDGLHVSYIFMPIGTEQIISYADECNVLMTEELQELFKECNGIRLFLSSFSLYGFQSGQEEMEPYDIRMENNNIHARMKENSCDVPEWFFIGAYGDYVFALDTADNQRIKCMENGYADVEMTFATVDDLLHYFIPRMIDKYKGDFCKKKPNEEFKMIPALANAMFDINEIK